MKKTSLERQYMIDFWTKSRYTLSSIKSIKDVYKRYRESVPDGIIVMNEYKFREYIRKNGYCNSCTNEKVCKKCQKNLKNNRVEKEDGKLMFCKAMKNYTETSDTGKELFDVHSLKTLMSYYS